MKTKFYFFYEPNPEREKLFWEHCEYIIDTNVLLDLLRLDGDLTTKALEAISNNRERIHIPFFAGIEYHRHFREVIDKQLSSLKKIKQNPHDVFNSVLSNLGEARLPDSCKRKLFDAFKPPIEVLFEEINNRCEYFTKISQGLEIQNRVGKYLDGLVMDSLTAEDISELEKKGEDRYKKKIPPGYKDSNKDYNKYGDYIIWSEILRFAEKNKCDVCFVSRDNKEDWFESSQGHKICPRYELLYEFQSKSPGSIFKIISLDYFLANIGEQKFSKEDLADVKGINDKEEGQKDVPCSFELKDIEDSVETNDKEE